MTGVTTSSSVSVRGPAGLCRSIEGDLPYFLRFCCLLSSRSSSHAKSARWRVLLDRAGASPCFLALISMSAFARDLVLVLGFLATKLLAASAGAPVGIRTLTSDVCVLCSLCSLGSLGRDMAPKSSLGSVFSMPWSEGLKLRRIRRHAARSSSSVWGSMTGRLIQGELEQMLSLELCLRCDVDDDAECEDLGSDGCFSSGSAFAAIFWKGG